MTAPSLYERLGGVSSIANVVDDFIDRIMRDPTTAAHLLGKLLKHIGEDNVLWGTDSIWYGSPQDQIQAFRSFQIAPELIEEHGYPELTPSLKQKVFGLNGARVYGIDVPERRRKTESDPIGTRKQAYRNMTSSERYEPYDFANRRHIGPSPEEMTEMLRVVGIKSLDQLISETVPEAIRQKTPLDFGPPLSERGVLDRMRATANKNRVLTSLIGQGYHGAIMAKTAPAISCTKRPFLA